MCIPFQFLDPDIILSIIKDMELGCWLDQPDQTKVPMYFLKSALLSAPPIMIQPCRAVGYLTYVLDNKGCL